MQVARDYELKDDTVKVCPVDLPYDGEGTRHVVYDRDCKGVDQLVRMMYPPPERSDAEIIPSSAPQSRTYHYFSGIPTFETPEVIYALQLHMRLRVPFKDNIGPYIHIIFETDQTCKSTTDYPKSITYSVEFMGINTIIQRLCRGSGRSCDPAGISLWENPGFRCPPYTIGCRDW